MNTLDSLLFELSQRDVHLWLEGERLRYRAAKDAITPELLIEIKNRKAEIVQFLRQATQNSSPQLPPIVKIDRNTTLPLSFAQQRLWYLHKFEPDSSSNNMPVVFSFRGILNVSALEKSLHSVIARHEVLRTIFPSVNGQPTQVILPEVDIDISVEDLRLVPTEYRDAKARKRATALAQCSFNLETGPMIRVLLLQLTEVEHLLVFNIHNIVCDAASSDVFYQDFNTLYTAYANNQDSPLPELSVQYVDFANWQRNWLQGEVLESQLNYWKQKLQGPLSAIQLPTDHPRPHLVQTYRSELSARVLSKSLNADLTSLSQKLGGTLFMVLIATFEILLHRYSQQKDILITFASASRGHIETERVVGFFSNTLVQRINFEGDLTFRELFERVREASLEANMHQDLPFEKLVEELPPELTRSRSPLFQIKFALNPPWSNGRGMASVQLPDLTITPLINYIDNGETKYDLALAMREQENGLEMVIGYNADLFESSTIARMMGHFQTLLESIVANPEQKIAVLPMLTTPEKQQILSEWNNNNVPIPELCIHQLFESQVAQTPEAIAVIAMDAKLTYRELNSRANQLAHYLQSQGVDTETMIAICVERSADMLIAMLGVLKAGGTYIPLNPDYPHDRRISKLRNAQVSFILTQANLLDSFSEYGFSVFCLDANWEAIAKCSSDNLLTSIDPDNLAYVIYTSGSTGEPKGVTISHRSMVNHCLAVGKVYELNTQDRVLQFSNISFDVAIEEIFPTWLKGGTLILAQPEVYNSITKFIDSLAQQAITVINIPTAFWNEMVSGMSILDYSLPKSLRLVIVGGEKVSKATYQKWRSLVGDYPRWLNGYGPTEATVTATIYDPCSSENNLPADSEIPIGRAIANLQTYVLDVNLQPCPIGVNGELYIGGVGLSRGYLNRPDITAERFIRNPFSNNPKDRLYKTGDTAFYLPDGNIGFIGRSDFQIKIRGFRVEPLEVETQLEKYPAVSNSVVLCQESPNGYKILVAYLSSKEDQGIDVEDLKNFLQRKLPSYMIPSSFVILDTLPLTANGKVDRQALLTLGTDRLVDVEVILPRDELEQRLASIWQKLLGINEISVNANFFELGGNSLLSVRLVTEIEKVFNYHFPISSFFEMGTIAKIANWMREKPSETISPEDVPLGLSLEDYRAFLSLCGGRIGKHIGKRGLIVEVPPTEMKSSRPFVWIGYIDFGKNLGLPQPVYTIPGGSWTPLHSTENYIEAIASVIVDELLSIPQDEPYLIGGNCYEGLVAMEVACQLQKKGKKVDFLAIIDREGPSKIYDVLCQLDLKLCILKFHLMQFLPLSLTEKGKYILERLFSFNAMEEINKSENELDFSQFMADQSPEKPHRLMSEYDRILPQAWDSIDEVCRNHSSKVFSGKVVLTAPKKSGLKSRTKDVLWTDLSWLFPYCGWGKLLTGKVSLHKLDCAHADVGMKKNADQIGQIIWKATEEFRS
ncbi:MULTISPECIES: amino acid adenylation domain-containing protein [Pseudanabaena]|uniref:amino acid adenylation domain-containing protein n=1 Tax=Pseudanabaena TaxID=1152 RepID=UPI0024788E3F|nr:MULTISPECIES: amino acid adenylation domain-containing protein [Pseudanabaena]MEA5489205.1 amino acid adenylation domain-containing protein [Pseudanabaena sp. CCNP1317]WGS73789.1 amino acid adenylation domain-containing protein [Pseudanabaena galeata CCNP1313]